MINFLKFYLDISIAWNLEEKMCFFFKKLCDRICIYGLWTLEIKGSNLPRTTESNEIADQTETQVLFMRDVGCTIRRNS